MVCIYIVLFLVTMSTKAILAQALSRMVSEGNWLQFYCGAVIQFSSLICIYIPINRFDPDPQGYH